MKNRSHFCGMTGTPILHLWWCLPWVSMPGWIHASWLACFLVIRPNSYPFFDCNFWWKCDLCHWLTQVMWLVLVGKQITWQNGCDVHLCGGVHQFWCTILHNRPSNMYKRPKPMRRRLCSWWCMKQDVDSLYESNKSSNI